MKLDEALMLIEKIQNENCCFVDAVPEKAILLRQKYPQIPCDFCNGDHDVTVNGQPKRRVCICHTGKEQQNDTQ